jgi:hypothetical protein
MGELAAWIAAGLAALFPLHRVALWMERRGWLYYAGDGSAPEGEASETVPERNR